MGLESVTRITDLVTTNPVAGDPRSEGDDHLRNIKTAVKTLLGFPRAHAYRTTSQTITTGVSAAVSFDAEIFDPQGMHDNAVNPTRLTVPASEGGYYLFIGQVRWAAGVGGTARDLFLRKNGTTTFGPAVRVEPASIIMTVQVVAIIQLSAADYVELMVVHDRGSDLDIETPASPNFQIFLQAVKLFD